MDEIATEDDWGSVLKSHLYPGESLVWVGRPSPGRFKGAIAAEIVVGVFLTMLGLTGLATLGTVALREGPLKVWPGLAGGLVFAIGGIYCLSAPVRYRRALAAAIYAVTTERAVIVNGFGYAPRRNLCRLRTPDRSFHHATVRGRAVKRRRDGSGDIVFDCERRRSHKSRYWVEIGFFGVPDVDQVDTSLGRITPGRMRFDLESPLG